MIEFRETGFEAALIERKAALMSIWAGEHTFQRFRERGEIPAVEEPHEGSLVNSEGTLLGIHLIGKGGRYDFLHSSRPNQLTTLVIARAEQRAWTTSNPYTNDNWDTINVTCQSVENEFYELEADLLANYACIQCRAKTDDYGAWDLNGVFEPESAIHNMNNAVGFERFGEFPDITKVYIGLNGLCQHCDAVFQEREMDRRRKKKDAEKLNKWNRLSL